MIQKKITSRLFALFLLLFSCSSLHTATITVMNSDDAGAGSLREAVTIAAPGDMIVFDESTDLMPIILTSEIVVNKTLTFTGNGNYQTVISGNDLTRIFNIMDAGTVVFNKLGLTNGRADNGGAIMMTNTIVEVNTCRITNSVATGATSVEGGGAIFNSGGTLTIQTNSVISGNMANGASGSGGAIFNGPGGALNVLSSSTLSENHANRAGGAIEDQSGAGTMVLLFKALLLDNSTGPSPGNGGGLHVTGDGAVFVLQGLIRGNTATSEGGGLWNGAGIMELRQAQVRDNTASGADPDMGGGGIFNLSGDLRVLFGSQITGNKADGASGSGGGILNDVGGILLVRGATIAMNDATRAGGGIEDNSGSGGGFVRLIQTRLDDNTTGANPGNGGGFHMTGSGYIEITKGTVNGNTASREGGGLWNGTGTMRLDDVVIDGNTAAGPAADDGGGGIFNNGGTLILRNNNTITNNLATGTGGSGGGIFSTAGAVTINNSFIEGNSANRAGGGIEIVEGNLTLTNTSLDENDVNGTAGTANPGNGGGLHVTGVSATVTVTGGTASGNLAAREGGGLWNQAGSTMTISGTLIDGNSAFGSAADDGGGGVFNNGGTLNVVGNTMITDNHAPGTSGSGGGIFSTAGNIMVINSTLSGNDASRAGGGFEVIDGTVTISDSNLDNNSTGPSPGNGGGLHVTGMSTTVDLIRGSVSGNMASSEGGGLWNQSGSTMTVTECTISGNVASGMEPFQGGGGLFNNGGVLNVVASTISENQANGGETGSGGGIGNDNEGTVTVSYSTISGNTAVGAGGGIGNNATVTVIASTITQNTALLGGGFAQGVAPNSATFQSSIVAENEATATPPLPSPLDALPGAGQDIIGDPTTFTSLGYNLIGQDDAGVFLLAMQSSDQVGTLLSPISPMLEPLADNGGPTATHALSCGSLAIDAGDPGLAGPDQRGEPIFNGTPDIGSFELQSGCAMITPAVAQAEELKALPDSIDDMSPASMVYPNPTRDGLIHVLVSEKFGMRAEIRVMDASGQVVRRFNTAVGLQDFDLSNLAQGSYTLQILSDTAIEAHKLILLQ